jgi:hypothetical protein
MHNLYLHPEKCKFEQAKIDYLVLVISHGKVSIDPVKIKAIVNWPVSKSLKEVQSFIGFANFYQHFIENFSKICCPLHDLSKKNVLFVWGPSKQPAFNQLKTAFTTKLVLAIWAPE